MPEGVQCHVLRSTAELEAFAPQWSALWSSDPRATPFQAPEWLLPWWRQFGQLELRAVVITEGEQLFGFLPFYIYREPQRGERQLLLLGAGTTDYLDAIFSPACTTQHVDLALDKLREDTGWDMLYATQLRPHSLLFQALQQPSHFGARPFDGEHCSQMPAARFEKLPQKIRRNAMYYRNRAMRVGQLELAIADASDWAASFEALVRLHTQRWQGRGEAGVLADKRVLACHREALPLLQRSGLLRLCSLRLDGEIIGVLYSLLDPPSRARRTQYFYLTAYATAHAELRPGTLLLALSIDYASGEGVETIDMLRGDEAYKSLWHLEAVPTRGFAVTNPACTAASAPKATA